VLPDIMTVAKGITNAAVPMGAVFVRRGIYDQVVNSVTSGIEFFHGYTYSGHPLACAAAMATLDVYEHEGLFDRAASLAPVWEEAVHSLRGLPHVIDVRQIGLVAGIELETRAGAVGARAMDVMVDCFFNRDVLVRVTADTIALSPPLVIDESEIARLIDRLGDAIREVA
jgi:beta-alanine--pyruvate transaminase